jgi:hypothetical protein
MYREACDRVSCVFVMRVGDMWVLEESDGVQQSMYVCMYVCMYTHLTHSNYSIAVCKSVIVVCKMCMFT